MSDNKRDNAGLIAVAVIGAVYAVLAAIRIHNHWAVALDLSVFDQGLWLLSQGKAPQVTVIGDNLFADHLSLVLLLFVPLYKLTPSSYWLVVIQAFALAITVLPLRALAAELGLPRWVGTAAVAASAPILSAALFDFHPITLATPAIAWAVLAAVRGDPRALTYATITIALMRADVVWVVVGLALVTTPACRKRIAIVVPPILVLAVVVPSLLHSPRQQFGRVYGSLGDILTTAVSGMPLRILAIWLLPVGFILLLRWRWLLAVVISGLPFLLSSISGIAEPWFYYAAVFMPIVAGGAMTVVADPKLAAMKRWTAGFWAGGAVLALALTSPLSPLAPSSARIWRFITPRDVPGYDEALARIGPNDRVAAEFDLLPPLAYREQAYILPCPFADLPNELLCVEATKAGATTPTLDVVLARNDRRDLLEQHGYRVEPLPGGELLLARREGNSGSGG